MTGNKIGKYHQQLRKSFHGKLAPYPHPEKWKNILDTAIFFIGVLGPILVLPQLIKVWTLKDATGLSLLTWTLWIFVDSVWILYGFVHRVMPIIVSHCAYILVQAGVVLGIVLYG